MIFLLVVPALYLTYYAVTAGLPNMRLFYLVSFGIIYLLQVMCRKKRYMTFLFILIIGILIHYRVYFGPIFISCPNKIDMSIVLVTTSFSSRQDVVEPWVRRYLSAYPFYIENNESMLYEPNRTFISLPPEYYGPRVTSYTIQMYDLMYHYNQYSTSVWILFLEDDAIPLSVLNIENTLICCSTYSGDVIYLDYRNIVSGYVPGSFAGAAGMLYRRTALPKIAEEMRFGLSRVTRMMGHDSIIGRAIEEGRINGTVVVSIREKRDETSTLDWGRVSSDRHIPWLEILIVFSLSVSILLSQGNKPSRLKT